MKNKTSNEKMANGQQSQDIQNTPAIKFQITVHGNSAPGIFPAILPPFAARQGTDGCSNTIRGHHIGKAPPGRARAPGRARGHPPANKAGPPDQTIHKPEASPLATCREENVLPLGGAWLSHQTTFFNSNNPIINTKTSINFINNLNFKIMKKQILILALFVMAMFASVTNSYGQCAGSSITPVTGVDYPYGIDVTGLVGTSPTYSWFVTMNTDLKAGELAPLTATDGYFTIESGAATNTLHLKWTPKAVSGVFYVVAKYSATSSSGCLVTNMKTIEVKPINMFLLAITGSTVTGGNAQVANCAAEISAIAVTAATPTVQYTYGQNTIYYEVTASGILGGWKPSIRIPALASDQTYASASWSSDGGTNWTACTGLATTSATQDLGLAADATVANVAGSKYIIRLIINNNNFETLADQTLAVAIDGLLPAAYAVSDVYGGSGPSPDPCAEATAFYKTANYTITGRPTIGVGTLTGPGTLIPKLPNP